MHRSELAELPTVVDVPTAARALGIGHRAAYALIKDDEFPTPVLRLGKLIRIPTAPILVLLSLESRPCRCDDGDPLSASSAE